MRRLMLCALLLAACNREKRVQNVPANGPGNAARGKEAIARYGCSTCHNIPGVDDPRGMVGPPLNHFATHPMIAGKFQNTSQNLIRWIQNPQSMDPNTSMPDIGVTEQDAKDITAYLATLE